MFIHYDHTAQVYEVFAADMTWMGCFDSRDEANDFIDAELRRTNDLF